MSVKEKVDAAFEEFREYLVSLLGDHHGVHSTVDDAKAAIQAHVPVDVVQTEDTSNAGVAGTVPSTTDTEATPTTGEVGGEPKPNDPPAA